MLEAILQHPDFYEGPELVTPPVVYNAGLLRAIGRPIDTNAWAWISADAGQQLFYPPNVSGWDFGAGWTPRPRGALGNGQRGHLEDLREPLAADGRSEIQRNRGTVRGARERDELLGRAAALQRIGPVHRPLLGNLPAGTSKTKWELSPYRAMRQNALRMLIATSPDMQVS